MNGIISASKLTLRHWRDVQNGKHVVSVLGRPARLSLYLTSASISLVRKRWASAGKASDSHRITQASIPAITAAARLSGRSALLLRTLSKDRLDAEDFVDITGQTSKTVRFPAAPEEPSLEIRYFQSSGRKTPFPPDSRRFFYWHLESDALPVSGQVRFHTTTSSDPATFSSGRDLQLPDGRIWHVPLFRIARGSQYSGLRAQLLSENLVIAKAMDTALNGSASFQGHHRIPNSGIPDTTAAGLPTSALLLHTLNQTRLHVDDFADLTGRVKRALRFPSVPEEPGFEMHYFRSPWGDRKCIPFPPDSRGFVYWYLERNAPPLSGQVRFRATTSSDPATFPSGRDLQLPDGRTWNIPLARIAHASKYSGLRAQLLFEKLLTTQMLDNASNISASYQNRPRIPKSDLPATAAIRLRRRSAQPLRTLKQAGLQVEDFLAIAGRVTKNIRFPLPHEEPSLEMCYFQSGGRKTPFPPDSQGFLYWHLNPDAPPVSGQIRFRITKSSDPATFPCGRDLQLPNGRTWNISLSRIAHASKYSALRERLLSEKLVTAKVLDTVWDSSASSQDKPCPLKFAIPAATVTRIQRSSALLLRTLDPARLEVEDFVDIAGRVTKTIRFPLAPEEPRLEMHYFNSGRRCIPFPQDSQGFLYWCLEPDAPPGSGQVRFRTTSSSDPATFPSGRDLQLPDGRTWHIPLSRITRRSQYFGLRAHLLSEELVTAAALDSALNICTSSRGQHRTRVSDAPSTAATGLRNRSTLPLRTLNQTRIDAEDFVDLAGRFTKLMRFPLVPEEPSFRLQYVESGGRAIPFPPDAQGFFYWHLESDRLPLSGQVRFRTTVSSDPATFPTGRDLQLPNGGTWRISLSHIAQRLHYLGLRAHLLSETLVTAKVLETALNGSASSQDEHRISKSDVPATAPTGLRTGSALQLRTLDKTRLNVADFTDLSGGVFKTVRFALVAEELRLRMRYLESGGRSTPFPSNSQGFLYWHLDPGAPPVSGQVRFRTTTSSNPATFPIGRDLQLPDGRMWHISLFDIARRAKYSGLRAHLLSENLVTVNVLNTAQTISARTGKKTYHPATGSLLIWTFGQSFLVDLTSNVSSLWVIGHSAGERLVLPSLSSVCVRETDRTEICYVLSENRDPRGSRQTAKYDFLNGVDYTPLAGRALVQFERSTLPEHEGTRTVVLRVLKVMTNSDGSEDASWMLAPQEKA
ncbi:hypothetical protein OE88DRAFT_1739672 [Heliocybe sulcata]|uniref:Uncharacterized protein n=1 Tax=Heliocybe sulcata TaxID=5364 RepID=A0A5C3MLQ6_9AGAM|nr:hypothetical protein OE88DRAFT_1739672 [Heliocybe sulcata]